MCTHRHRQNTIDGGKAMQVRTVAWAGIPQILWNTEHVFDQYCLEYTDKIPEVHGALLRYSCELHVAN